MFANPLIRLLFGAAFALVVTTALLLLMQTLIHGQALELEKKDARKIADIFMGDTSIEVQKSERKPDKPEEPEDSPPPTELEPLQDAQVNAEALNLQPNLQANIDFAGPSLSASDGEYLPFYKMQPNYPRRAIARGIEGYCTVSYTVTKSGSTRDLKVVDCSSKLFERASMQAAAEFKYKPRVINGEAVEVLNVKNKFNFKLQ